MRMSGPPPGPTPQGLSSLLPQGGAPPMGGPGGPGPMMPNPGDSGSPGGLKDVFDEVQEILDSLASILPDQATELDLIKSQLAEILAKAISGGASFQGSTGGDAASRPNPGLPF